MAKVVLEHIEPSAPFEKRVFYLGENESIRFGRPKTNECMTSYNALFKNSVISLNHAEMEYQKGKFYLKDTSRNGTFINGYKLQPKTLYPLLSGDIIEMGMEAFNNTVEICGIMAFVKLFPIEDDEAKFHEKIQEEYPCSLQLYNKPPLFEFNVEVLHMYSKERLKVLQILSKVGETLGNKWIDNVTNVMQTQNLIHFREMVMGTSVSPKEEYLQRKGDHVSYFIMLLACCRGHSASRWFYKQEVKLFELRWHFMSESQRSDFLKLNQIELKRVPEKKLTELIKVSSGFMNEKDIYFEVDFQEVSNLVRLRKVFIYKGLTYITKAQSISFLSKYFQNILSQKLKIAKTKLPLIQYDERIRFLLQELRLGARENYDRIGIGRNISSSAIHPLSKKSFPLCMELLHRYLLRDHHLRNGGRFQYNNFLKCIGVSVNNAQIFWSSHFKLKMDSQEIEKKKYMYEFRHSYGKEGKRFSYPPQSCDKIMDKSPGPLDHHGCPFRVLDVETLKLTLVVKKGLNGEDAKSIVETAQKGMPQVACAKYFEVIHGEPMPAVVTHPHKYFEYSQKFYKSQELFQAEKITPREEGGRLEKKKGPQDSTILVKGCLCSDKIIDW